MRTMILSCNTGEGHNSCARAIREVYDAKGETCVVYDALKFISPGVSRFMAWGHVFMYRHMPWFFNWGYGFAERHPKAFDETAVPYLFFAKGASALCEEIKKREYDTVICTHPFSALMMTEVKKRIRFPLKSAFVATDYTCSPCVKNSNLDFYFLPDESLKAEFVCDNIPQTKMVFSGIPIRQVFYEKTDKTTAKQMIGIQKANRHFVLMCGSMGCGPMKELVGALHKDLPKESELTVICGKNEKLQRQMERMYGMEKRIHIVGFVENVSLLLDSADLYLTKPGGISTSEAAIKGVPMVFINAVSGCEAYNRNFFVKRGCAKAGLDIKEVEWVCETISFDDALLKRMAQNLEQREKRNASEIIYEALRQK